MSDSENSRQPTYTVRLACILGVFVAAWLGFVFACLYGGVKLIKWIWVN